MSQATNRVISFFGAVSIGASFLAGGCSTRNANIEPVAQAIEQPTPKPKPTPTPGPTPRPKRPGIALFKVETRQKVFALSFDDGPDPSYTPKILKILQDKKAPATFFMVGQMVRAHAPTGKLVVQAGYPIGNHTWSHPMKTRNAVAEVDRTDAIIKEKLGVSPTIFRPPYGILRNGLAREASKINEDVILWSSDSADWKHGSTSSSIHNNVMRNIAPGGIALMHDGGGNRSSTVAALPGIIDAIRGRGYKLVTVPELLNMGAPEQATIPGVPRRHIAKKPGAKKTGAIKSAAKSQTAKKH